jgi:hypothetical protein
MSCIFMECDIVQCASILRGKSAFNLRIEAIGFFETLGPNYQIKVNIIHM